MTQFRHRTLLTILFGLGALAAVDPARATELIQNGSLEDLNSTFVDQGGGYMSLAAGSTTIPDWTVSNSTIGSVAWGNGALAFFVPEDGSYAVDLTGLGASSPNGGLSQVINTTDGVTYTVQLYASTQNDTILGVTVDGSAVSLSTPLGPGLNWTLLQGSFVGDANNAPIFEVYNAGGGGFAAFVDAVSVTPASDVSVPEPAGLALFGVAVGALGMARRRRNDRAGRPGTEALVPQTAG